MTVTCPGCDGLGWDEYYDDAHRCIECDGEGVLTGRAAAFVLRKAPSAQLAGAAALVCAAGRRGQADWNERDGLSGPPPERTPRRFLLERHWHGDPAARLAAVRELAVLEALHNRTPDQ